MQSKIKSSYAPIALFVYNRPDHTRKTLEALAANALAAQSVLYIFADGPKVDDTPENIENIKATREFIREKPWCKEVIIREAENNKGLADSIVQGVTDVVNQHGRVIVLEDDIVTSPGFLTYMNDALDFYADEEKVMHISGYMHPVEKKLPETFFYNANSCWGWATWERAWCYYNHDVNALYQQLQESNVSWEDFNRGQGHEFEKQLIRNLQKKLKTWAVRWHTSIFLENGLCLHPNQSLIQNIGFDGSGTNFKGAQKKTDNPLKALPNHVKVEKIPLEQSNEAVQAVKKAYEKKKKKKPEKSVKTQPTDMIKKIGKAILNRTTDTGGNSKDDLPEIYRSLRKLPRYQEGTTELLGKKMHFVDATTFIGGYKEIFAKDIYNFKAKSEAPLIIDCGANIGLSVIYFKNLYPNARIIAFEPDPHIAQTLQKNIDSFCYQDIEVNNKAIWKDDGYIEFQVEGGFSGRIPKPGDKEEIVKVGAARLKNLLDEKVDFLKIDIEGAEYEVLLDAKEKLSNVDNIFIEYHSHVDEPQKLHEILLWLSEQGFRYHIHEAFSSPKPYINRKLMLNMDLQLNVFGYRT